MKSNTDTFAHLARYYDGLMEEINYDRWIVITSYLADLLPRDAFFHLDAGCGTGKLAKRLKTHGWNTTGADLSWGMMRAATTGGPRVPMTQADMCALPYEDGAFDFVTCLFDSLNFILEPELIQRALSEFARVLSPDGILYFDLVTERMVTEHFANQHWTENNGRFSTTWTGSYDRKKKIADTAVQINTGETTHIVERVYPTKDIHQWLKAAGLNVLGTLDAETWGSVSKSTIRIDLIATKANPKPLTKPFKRLTANCAKALR